MSYNVPAAFWDNKITAQSNRKLLLLAVSKRQNAVSLLSEIQAVQIHMELAANCWTRIHWRTAPGCFQTGGQTKWILAWDAWRQLDVYCLPLGLWRVTCYTVFTPFQIHTVPNDTNVTCCWKYRAALWPARHYSASPWDRFPDRRCVRVRCSRYIWGDGEGPLMT